MPEIHTSDWPDFYVAAWAFLVKRSPQFISRILRFALGLPRGHAKTTFVKVLITWLICYDKISFALVLCSNSDLAEALISDINTILSSPNITAIYGDWHSGLVLDSADTKKSAYHNRPVMIVARGWEAGVRGLNLENLRPDFILCDDVQTRKNDESPAESTRLLKELTRTIFKAIAPKKDRWIVYLGNMYSENCILNKFKNSKSWVSMITGAILEDGTALWPDLHSLEDLLESFQHDEELGEAEGWFAEVMNDPKSARTSILPYPLPACSFEDITTIDADGAFITIDPAGFRAMSDNNVIASHIRFENQIVTGRIDIDQKIPMDIVKTAIQMAVEVGASVIGIEDTGYQQTLLYWVDYFMKEFNVTGIEVVPLKPHGRSKEARIRQYISEIYAGNCHIQDPVTRRLFTWQASTYKIGKKDNKDDILDCIAYVQDIRNEYWELIINMKRINQSLSGECRVVGYNTPF